MYDGKVKSMLAFGMYGVSIGPNSQKKIDALKEAEFLVICDIYPEEISDFGEPTASRAKRSRRSKLRFTFWSSGANGQRVRRGGMKAN
jgi:hypothetical protein